LELLNTSAYTDPAGNDQSENGGLGDKKGSVFTRKAGYHYGWDWGPSFVTSGIWRPIELKAWDEARIKDVFIQQKSVKKEQEKLKAEFTCGNKRRFYRKSNRKRSIYRKRIAE